MSNSVSRYEDLERTDVLPQLSLTAADAETHEDLLRGREQSNGLLDGRHTALLPIVTVNLQTLPVKPAPIELEVGGIRGKISDLESRLLTTQDEKIDLGRQCQQLEMRSRALETRANQAEATHVLQAAELLRITQRATDAEQRLNEQRVRLGAQIAEIERQLLDARMRGDKRAIQLEQLLAAETARAAQIEQEANQLRIALEKLRAELQSAQSAVASLEERAAKQTRAAADISRLYTQQSSQAEAYASSLEKNHQHIARLQTANTESEQSGAALKNKLQTAQADIVQLQADIMSRRNIADEMQQQMQQRDEQITDLLSRGAAQQVVIDDLQKFKQTIEAHNAELQANLLAEQDKLAQKQAQLGRLENEIQQQEERLLKLETAKSQAQATLAERDQRIEQQQAHSRDAEQRDTNAKEQIFKLDVRVQTQSQEIDALRNELQMRHAEFAESVATIESLKKLSIGFGEDKTTLQDKITVLESTVQNLTIERDALEVENRVSNAELRTSQTRYTEAVQAIVTSRETISVREQRNATLEHELRSIINQTQEATQRVEQSTQAMDALNEELRARDSKISMLEQQLADHVAAISAIDQDIERVTAAHPNDAYASLGYVLEAADNSGVVHRIARATTTIGRSNSNDIAIDSTSVSRYHARLLVKPEGVWLVDLQSTNGCGVNGRRAGRQILCDGDTVYIGHCRFRFSTSAIETRALTEKSHEAAALSMPNATNSMSNSSSLHH